MQWNKDWKVAALVIGGFILCFYLPVGSPRFDHALLEAFHLVKWYAREHVILCLVPAFFIAGAIAVFVSQASVMKYLGVDAPKPLAYGVASVSGSILAVCSCTVLPLFVGIYRMGAGLGPATAFLYSGPAINVLAIILTARILGLQLGIARAVGAIVFSMVIGILMHIIFRHEDQHREHGSPVAAEDGSRPLWQTSLYFASMVAILIFANWAKPDSSTGIWASVFAMKWWLTAVAGIAFAIMLVTWFHVAWWKVAASGLAVVPFAWFMPQHPEAAFAVGALGLATVAATTPGEPRDWMDASWGFAKQILPLLLLGVLAAGLLLGRPGQEGLLPNAWIAGLVGGNSFFANFFAAVVGAFMYFATLTEVPILQGLIGAGMGQGPALALLLAGPALSLPNMLVIRSVLGTKKTVVFVALVVVMATASGLVFGLFACA